ncbi:MAG TPA: adenylate/guanylate cyclase domain-containing protein [Flavobacteriales bacterium]|nr:adenylate/guanylate cyclase domain-containing protein [Flavobacteriales bacterium]
MRYALLILLGFILLTSLHAQKQGQLLIDSLLAELPKQREDTSKVNILNMLSREHNYLGDHDTALYYAEQAWGQAEKAAFTFGIAMAYKSKGNVYVDLGDYARALEYYSKALDIYGQGANKSGMATVLGNIGVVYEKQNDYPKALEYFQSALQVDEQLSNAKGVARHRGNMARVYIELSEYPRALQDLQRALTINERYGNARSLAINLTSIGNVYDHMHDLPKALEYYQRALSINERSGYERNMAGNLTDIGGIHYDLADFPKALEYHQKALIIHEELGDRSGMAASFGNIGIAYQALADFPKALEYAQRSLAISRELDDKYGLQCDLGNIGIWYSTAPDAVMRSMGIDPDKKYQLAETYLDSCMQLSKELNMLDEEKKNWGHFSDLYEKQGDFAKAYAAYKKYILLRDSIQGEEAKKQITRKEMQYEFDKKEALAKVEQEKKDQRARMVRNTIGGGLAFAVLFLGVVWRQRNKIAKARRRSDELLLNILPEEVAEELKEKGSAEAVHIDQVTVLFTDFKGFTAMSEQLTPKELVRDIHECFSAFDHIMAKHGIEKIKTIGDAYMAAGGLPTPNTTHATDVINAALEMRDFIAEGKALKTAKGLPYFEIRIGVHTGPVVAGIVGVKKFAYDIWGDTVNTASRMESSGEVGQVNISEATYDLVKDASTSLGTPAFTFTPRGKVLAKGKGELEMYFVTNA